MRKVGSVSTEADEVLEGKIMAFEAHLERCMREFDAIYESEGPSDAVQSTAAAGVAQYVEALRVLREVAEDPGEDKWVRHMLLASEKAVAGLRDGDSPRWRHLASATVLEVLAECMGVS